MDENFQLDDDEEDEDDDDDITGFVYFLQYGYSY